MYRLLLLVLLCAAKAHAIPAFARKYGTSCATCHTVYPKLNGFGESFRRHGFRFPGVDSDAVKHEAVPLGQERDAKVFPAATWPGTLPGSLPLAISFDGQALAHPDATSSAGRADHGTPLSLQDLVAEGHLWAGGSFDDRLTFFAQLTVATNHTIELEDAELHFGDLFGPPGTINLVVGKGSATLSSFGPHSSYVGDTLLPEVAVAGLYGAQSDTFALTQHSAGLELNGLAAGRFSWAVGLRAGPSLDVRPSENVYAQLGLTVGGRRLDEGSPAGAETSLTLDAFAAHASSHFSAASGSVAHDSAAVLGVGARGTFRNVELDTGFFWEGHAHAQAGLADPTHDGAQVWVHYDELSWAALPWLVPALRLEYFRVGPEGGAQAWDFRVLPAVAMLVRQNLKVLLVAQFESAHGAPPAGWSHAGGSAAPAVEGARVPFENESVMVRLEAAF